MKPEPFYKEDDLVFSIVYKRKGTIKNLQYFEYLDGYQYLVKVNDDESYVCLEKELKKIL